MLCVYGGYVIDPKSGLQEKLDLYIKDGIIISMQPSGTDKIHADETLDATGCVVAPGLIDVHVHFRDPGLTYKEDIMTGASAAAAGGFTTVVCMANTKPVVDSTETLQYVLNRGKETSIHVESCAAITQGLSGQTLNHLSCLKEAGAVGFTDDGIPIRSASLLREAMVTAQKLNVPISLHEENPELIKENGIHAGEASRHFGIGGSPREAEITMVERDLQLALETGCQTNIQHISTKEALNLVRQAKAQGNNIHAEGTPHHFSLTQNAVIEKGALAKVNPPLREESDRQAIIRGIADGTIDMIATDHAPHSAEEKARELTLAPSGMIGLETALPLAVTHLHREAGIPLMTVLERMTVGPAKFYGFDRGYIAEGGPADLVIFHPDESYQVHSFHSKSWNSPFIGETLFGKVHATVCNGKIVYQV